MISMYILRFLVAILMLSWSAVARLIVYAGANGSDVPIPPPSFATHDYFQVPYPPGNYSPGIFWPIEVDMKSANCTFIRPRDEYGVISGTNTPISTIYNATVLFLSWGKALDGGCITYAQAALSAQSMAAAMVQAGFPPLAVVLIAFPKGAIPGLFGGPFDGHYTATVLSSAPQSVTPVVPVAFLQPDEAVQVSAILSSLKGPPRADYLEGLSTYL